MTTANRVSAGKIWTLNHSIGLPAQAQSANTSKHTALTILFITAAIACIILDCIQMNILQTQAYTYHVVSDKKFMYNWMQLNAKDNLILPGMAYLGVAFTLGVVASIFSIKSSKWFITILALIATTAAFAIPAFNLMPFTTEPEAKANKSFITWVQQDAHLTSPELTTLTSIPKFLTSSTHVMTDTITGTKTLVNFSVQGKIISYDTHALD